MKMIACIAILLIIISAGCDTIPSAGVNANPAGGTVSSNAGWGPVSGSVNSNGGFGVNVR